MSRALIVLFLLSGCRSANDDPPVVTFDAEVDSAIEAATDSMVMAETAPAETGVDGALDTAPALYQNPVLSSDFPDPFVLRAEGAYYAFATNAGARNVQTARSTDLAHWTLLDDALPKLPSWAKSGASLTWAPSVLARGSSYVLYYTARYEAAGFQCISRAVSSKPQGPYVDDSTEPMVCQIDQCGSIDPSPFVDGGQAWLLWKSDENASECATDARLFVQPLAADGLSLTADPIVLLSRDRAWEAPLVEGPSMIREGGRYWLFYSANRWDTAGYGMGVAACDTPTGPCTKKSLADPWIGSIDPVLGPGGQELFRDGLGQVWMVYHAWTAPLVGYGGGGVRSMRIDRLDFSGALPALNGPSTVPRPL